MKNIRYKLFFLATLFLVPSAAYSQFFHNYESELNKYLNPPIDTTTTKEIAFFMGITTFPIPEYSIRIIKSRAKFSIEARVFEKNLSKVITEYEISVMTNKVKNPFTIETSTYIIPITDSLKDKILSVFNEVISNGGSVKPLETLNADGTISLMIYDGPTYKFVINKKVPSQIKIEYPLESSDFRSQVIRTNLQIINDLKYNCYDESKYDIYK